MLVVAHTKDLVEQLERALWCHLPKETRTQVLTGDVKPDDLPWHHLRDGRPAPWRRPWRGYRPSLVMVDETHHVGENGQFAELLDLLEDVPQFGVTATPWRGDKYDIRRRFGEPSYTLGIEEGCACGYLAQVDYRLFVDNIDWDVVRQPATTTTRSRNSTPALFLPQRDEAIIDELTETGTHPRSPGDRLLPERSSTPSGWPICCAAFPSERCRGRPRRT